MTEQRDPSPHESDDHDSGAEPRGSSPQAWDPWASPSPAAPEDTGREHTQPVDVHHTQSLPAGAGQDAPAGPPAWTYDPQPGTQQPSSPHQQQSWAGHGTGGTAYQQHGSDWAQGQHWPPAQQGAPEQQWQQGHDWTQSHHAMTQGAPPRRGPGWAAVVGIAVLAALFAGLLGGVAGGWLGATDRLNFGRLDRGPSPIPTVGSGATSRPAGSIANIAARALPSVVTIKVTGADGNGTGSGFVIDEQGHIITNNHVVAGAGDDGAIKVQLSNGTEIEATIAGRDASYDLAVLKTGRTDLQPLTMGSSSSVVVGDQVIAVGAPLGLDSTVTTGIVSALNRPVSPGGDGDEQSYINAIQTDAAINPGNSGGPLLDMKGNVIGVNSAIARVPGTSDSQSGNIGVGFSIPSDQVTKTADQLIKTGKAEHPIIGVILDRQYTGGDGVKILAEASEGRQPVTANGPAGKAGVRAGDLIVEFDGRKVTDPDDLVVAIRSKSVGDEVSMKVRRGDQEISVRMTLQGTTGE